MRQSLLKSRLADATVSGFWDWHQPIAIDYVNSREESAMACDKMIYTYEAQQ